MSWKRVASLLLGLFVSASATGADFVAETHHPLVIGHAWEYREAGNVSVTESVDAAEEILGAPTLRVTQSGGSHAGATEHLSNDASGLRVHRQFLPGAEGGTMTWSPPLVVAPPEADVGTTSQQQGSTTVVLPGLGTFGFSYDSDLVVVSREPRSVPFGTFDAVRIDLVTTVYGPIPGAGFFSETISQSHWYAEDVGVIAYDTPETELRELVTTNVPEPNASALAVAALLGLVAISGRRASRPRAPACRSWRR